MSTLDTARNKLRTGRKLLDEAKKTTPIRDVLDSEGAPARRKARLESSKSGVRNTLEGTRAINRLKRFRDAQSTDNSQ
jgi:hypothetical protein